MREFSLLNGGLIAEAVPGGLQKRCLSPWKHDVDLAEDLAP
jgi:hypothetical protein